MKMRLFKKEIFLIFIIIFTSCKPNESDMDNFLKKLTNKVFTDWRGFPDDFSKEKLNINYHAEGRLGIPPKAYQVFYFDIENYTRKIKYYEQNDSPVAFVIDLPDVPNADELIMSLDKPSYKEDYFLDVAKVVEGELIYLDKGITLFIDPSDSVRVIYKIKLFNPCSAEEYKSLIAEEASLPEEF